jgi:hypothetical protein
VRVPPGGIQSRFQNPCARSKLAPACAAWAHEILFLASLSLLIWAGVGASASAAPLRDGDIIFHTSRSAQSVAIQHATHSPYSHVG